MNTQQKAYALAKAHLEALEEQEREVERKYIAEHGIVNSDGNEPGTIIGIEDLDVFDKANEDIANITESSGLWGDILDARETLEEAEDALIAFGFSVIPPRLWSGGLKEAVKTDYNIRQNFLDMTFKLDAEN